MKFDFKDPKALVSTIASLISVPSTVTVYTQGFPPNIAYSLTAVSGFSVIFLIFRLVQLDKISNEVTKKENVDLTFDRERQYRKNWTLIRNAIFLDIVDTTGEVVNCKYVLTAKCIEPCNSFFLTTSPEDKIVDVQIGGNYRLNEVRNAGEVKIYIHLPSVAQVNKTYDFEVSFTFKNSFTKPKEFFKHRKYYEVPKNEIYISFHKDRPIKGYNVVNEIDKVNTIAIEQGVSYANIKSRPSLSVITDTIALDGVLLVEWEW